MAVMWSGGASRKWKGSLRRVRCQSKPPVELNGPTRAIRQVDVEDEEEEVEVDVDVEEEEEEVEVEVEVDVEVEVEDEGEDEGEAALS